MPQFVDMAINDAVDPEQMLVFPSNTPIVTVGITSGFTIMVMGLDANVLGTAQTADEVN